LLARLREARTAPATAPHRDRTATAPRTAPAPLLVLARLREARTATAPRPHRDRTANSTSTATRASAATRSPHRNRTATAPRPHRDSTSVLPNLGVALRTARDPSLARVPRARQTSSESARNTRHPTGSPTPRNPLWTRSAGDRNRAVSERQRGPARSPSRQQSGRSGEYCGYRVPNRG
jgi:hypothetical protein